MNLAPITYSANSLVSAGAEEKIHKQVFEENKVIHFLVKTEYGASAGPYIAAEGFLPVRLQFDIKTMKFDESVQAQAAKTEGGLEKAMALPENWVDDKSIKVDPVPSKPPLTVLPDTEVQKFLDWQKKVEGKPASAFKMYTPGKMFSPGETFKKDDLIRHSNPDLGDGFVLQVLENKISVRFGEKQTSTNLGVTKDLTLMVKTK